MLETLIAVIMAFGSFDMNAVDNYIAAFDNVESAYCVADGDDLLVAVMSGPIFTRTQLNEFKTSLSQALKDEFGFGDVVVNMDTDIYYNVKKLRSRTSVDQEAAAELMRSARVRR